MSFKNIPTENWMIAMAKKVDMLSPLHFDFLLVWNKARKGNTILKGYLFRFVFSVDVLNFPVWIMLNNFLMPPFSHVCHNALCPPC